MRIGELTLKPFRNLQDLHVDFESDRMLIVGGNGRGKSNLLEAISYLSIGKSIRGARDREAVPHGGKYFDISASWHDGTRDRQLRVFYGQEEGKQVFLDGAALSRVSDVLSLFQSVHFSPEDVTLVLRFAAQRRRLLDILICQAESPYLHDLQRYQRILTQRNRCLRGWRATPGSDELIGWDVQLCRLGGAIRHRRMQGLIQLAPDLTRFYRRLSTSREEVGVAYRGQAVSELDDAGLLSAEVMAEEMTRELAEYRDRERHAGHTLCGPHRDALTFTLDGVAADLYGSQGQLKGILVAWKMAELRFLEGCSGQRPVLLLDDVFSELDEVRSAELVALVEDFDQVLLTAPRLPGEGLCDRFSQLRMA